MEFSAGSVPASKALLFHSFSRCHEAPRHTVVEGGGPSRRREGTASSRTHLFLMSASRRPSLGVSTVSAMALKPARSARRTSCSTTCLSLYTCPPAPGNTPPHHHHTQPETRNTTTPSPHSAFPGVSRKAQSWPLGLAAERQPAITVGTFLQTLVAAAYSRCEQESKGVGH